MVIRNMTDSAFCDLLEIIIPLNDGKTKTSRDLEIFYNVIKDIPCEISDIWKPFDDEQYEELLVRAPFMAALLIEAKRRFYLKR